MYSTALVGLYKKNFSIKYTSSLIVYLFYLTLNLWFIELKQKTNSDNYSHAFLCNYVV